MKYTSSRPGFPTVNSCTPSRPVQNMIIDWFSVNSTWNYLSLCQYLYPSVLFTHGSPFSICRIKQTLGFWFGSNCVPGISFAYLYAYNKKSFGYFNYLIGYLRKYAAYLELCIWSSSVTLVLNLSEQMFQMALLVVKANKSVKLFWNPCINVGVMARTSSFYDHFIICPSSVTLTFNQPEKYFKYHSSSSRTSYGSDKSIRMHHACTLARTNAGTYTIKNCNSYVSLKCKQALQKGIFSKRKESALLGAKSLLWDDHNLYEKYQWNWQSCFAWKCTHSPYDSNGHYIYQAADMYHVFWILPYSNRNNILLHSQI